MVRGVLMTDAEAEKLGISTRKLTKAQQRANSEKGKLSKEQERALVKFIRRKKNCPPKSKEGRKAIKEKATAMLNKNRKDGEPEETLGSQWVTRFIDRRLMQEEKNRELAEKLQSGRF